MSPIERELRSFLADNYAVEDGDAIGTSESLIASGIVDSTGLLELVSFVETTYAIEIPDQDLLPENFETIESITTYIASRTRPAPVGPAWQA